MIAVKLVIAEESESLVSGLVGKYEMNPGLF